MTSKKTNDDTLPNLLHLAISGGGKSKQPKVITTTANEINFIINYLKTVAVL